MFAPTFLSEADRARLAKINQMLLTALSPDERDEIITERNELMAKRKEMANCTIDELHQLRQQLYEQYQQHAAIGSAQIHAIAGYMKQVEHREMMIVMHQVDEPEVEDEENKSASRGRSRVSTKPSDYSWSVNIDGDVE